MKTFRADLHIHTVLSPCGDLDMSPKNIVQKAQQMGIDIIGITDHNSTRQCKGVQREADINGIYLLMGAEVTTKEEVHCLVFFEDYEKLDAFQQYLDLHLQSFKNDPSRFGYQVVVDENEMIEYEEERLLILAIDQSIDQVEQKVHKLGGLFIPAHVDKSKNSILSQLGFIPKDLAIDALEISYNTTKTAFLEQQRYLKNYTFIQNSDAHLIENIGKQVSTFELERLSFSEISLALRGCDGRNVSIR
jgi:3',5'-nucleoside bisphosphate phosphatase